MTIFSASAAFTRSGLNGTVRIRAPVASKIVLAIAGAVVTRGRFSRARRGQVGAIDQDDVDLGRSLRHHENWIAAPVDARDTRRTKLNFFLHGALPAKAAAVSSSFVNAVILRPLNSHVLSSR